MNVDQLLEKIVAEEAGEERRLVLEIAQNKADAIVQEAEKEAADVIEENRPLFEQKGHLAYSHVVHQAEFDAQIKLAQEKAKIFNTFLEQVSNQLEEATQKEDYQNLLEKLLNETLSLIDLKARAYVRPEDVELVKSILTKMGRGAMDVVGADLGWGGLRLESEDGTVLLDNTLKSRFQKALEVYKESIGKDLFG